MVCLSARPLDARIQPVAHLVLVVAVELAAQKSGDVVRLHRVNGGPRQPLINRLQVALALEYDVGGELDLIQAPVVVEFERLHHRTVPVGEPIQFPMQHFDPELVGQFLSLLEVGDPAEGVVQHPVFDVALAHLPCQNTMAVTVELQPEGTPGRYPQRAKPPDPRQ